MKGRNYTLVALIGIIITIMPFISEAQNVAISDEPHEPDPSAVLDIYSNTKGLLIPRVALISPDNPVTGIKAVGLLVWNSAPSANYTAIGLHYWDGTNWKPIASTEYIANSSSTYISGATSYGEADELLDQVMVQLNDRLSIIETVNTNPAYLIDQIERTRTGAGLDIASGSYSPSAGSTYLGGATSLFDADLKLEQQLVSVSTLTSIQQSDITNLKTSVLNLNSQITNHQSDISTNTSDITDLNQKVNELEAADNQAELDATQAGAGLEADGSYLPGASTQYLTTALSLKDADLIFDNLIFTNTNTIGINSTAITNLQSDVSDLQTQVSAIDLSPIQNELDATQSGAGLNADGSYTANASSHFIGTATTLKNADELLDQQMKTVEGTASSNEAAIASLDGRVQTLEDNTATNDKFGTPGVVEPEKAIVAGSDGSVAGFNQLSTTGKTTIGNAAVNEESAILEVNSTTRGFLPPRLSLTEIEAISNPAEGLSVYCTTLKSPVFYDGTAWFTYSGDPLAFSVGSKYKGGIIFDINEATGEMWLVAEEEYTTLSTWDEAVDKANNYFFSSITDWYLPSKEEFQMLWDRYNAGELPSIAFNFIEYWTSSEIDTNHAYWHDLVSGISAQANKGGYKGTRFIRKITF